VFNRHGAEDSNELKPNDWGPQNTRYRLSAAYYQTKVVKYAREVGISDALWWSPRRPESPRCLR
jgi:hypothetical protein